jgi:predicted lactoylglutathione lyase
MGKLEVWANLPVKDVEKTREFFTKLGFKRNGSDDNKDLASFIFSDDHFVIHFFKQESFEEGAEISASDTSKGSEIMFTIGADSKQAVNEWRDNVEKAGGKIFLEPKDIKIGYNFGFADLDGHRWNVFYCY